MAPGVIQTEAAPASNGTSLKPTARSFHPTGTPDPSKYHAASSSEATAAEAKYAAHNYHPLPIGMVLCIYYSLHTHEIQSSPVQAVAASGTPRRSTTSTSFPRTAPSTKATATLSLSRL